MIESPINYMGSKYKLLEQLVPLFPKCETFVDLFAGGGSVYMNVAPNYKRVIVNEYINGVCDIHKNLFDKSFIQDAINYSIPTKESQDAYVLLRDNYNKSKDASMLLALIWSCNSNMMRFNNKFEFNQTWGKRCFNQNTQKKLDILYTKSFLNVEYQNKSFEEVKFSSDAFVYIDPPYSNTEAGYNAIWSDKNESDLIYFIQSLIDNNIKFGLSGTINDKYNRVYEHFKKGLSVHYFGDMYQKISKREKANQEYYITNCT